MTNRFRAASILQLIYGAVIFSLYITAPEVITKTTITGDTMNRIETKTSAQEYQDRIALLDKTHQVMNFIGGYRSLDALKKQGIFDREDQDVPKGLQRYSLRSDMYKKDKHIMVLRKKEGKSPWTSVSFFAKDDDSDNRYISIPSATFTNDLELSFIEVDKTSSLLHDNEERTVYTYKYQ